MLLCFQMLLAFDALLHGQSIQVLKLKDISLQTVQTENVKFMRHHWYDFVTL